MVIFFHFVCEFPHVFSVIHKGDDGVMQSGPCRALHFSLIGMQYTNKGSLVTEVKPFLSGVKLNMITCILMVIRLCG